MEDVRPSKEEGRVVAGDERLVAGEEAKDDFIEAGASGVDHSDTLDAEGSKGDDGKPDVSEDKKVLLENNNAAEADSKEEADAADKNEGNLFISNTKYIIIAVGTDKHVIEIFYS